MIHFKTPLRRARFLAAAILLGPAAILLPLGAHASGLTITTSPGLTPAFDPSITNYVVNCGTSTSAATTVTFTVSAPAGTSVAIDGTSPQSGNFSAAVARAWGQGFAFVVSTGGVPTTYHARCLPGDMPAFNTQRTGSPQAAYYIIAVNGTNPPASYTVIVDSNGVPVWWLKADPALRPLLATLLPNGNLAMTNSAPQNPQASVNAQVMTLTGSLVATLNSPDNPPSDIHDILLLPNGDYVLVAYPKVSGVDLSSIGGATNTCIIDGEVEEITPAGALVWSWFASQHFSPTEINHNIWARAATSTCTTPQDVWHLNSVEDAGADFVSSFRYTGVYRINKSTGSVLWKLGGTTIPQSLTISGDSATPPGGLGQHDARLYSDGSVSIFDNGNDGNSNPAARAPRVVRYAIDTIAATATLQEQLSDPAVTTPVGCCGSARRLSGGDWVVGWGSDNVETEMTPAGTRVFSLSGTFTYRMIPVLPGVLNADTLRSDMDLMNPVPIEWRTDLAPQAGAASNFAAIRALNASDVWAAGSYVQGGVSWPLLDHWDGTSWQRPLPPQAGSSSQFNAVAPLSDTDVWVAGSYVQAGVNWPLVDQWNGASWRVLPAPQGGSASQFTAVTALSDTDVWAAGWYVQGGANYPFLEQWNGTSWRVVPGLQGGSSSQFTAMTALSDTDVWAAGYYVQGGANHPFLEQWNGTSWQVLPALQGGTASQFTAMTVLSDTDVWAAGFYVQGGVNLPFLEQWNGTTWRVVPGLQGGSASQFTSLTALNDNDVWAAGSYSQGGVNLAFVEQWNGSSWRVLVPPQAGTAGTFNAISALGDTDVWVGGSYAQGGANWPYVAQYGPGTS